MVVNTARYLRSLCNSLHETQQVLVGSVERVRKDQACVCPLTGLLALKDFCGQPRGNWYFATGGLCFGFPFRFWAHDPDGAFKVDITIGQMSDFARTHTGTQKGIEQKSLVRPSRFQ